MVNMHLNKNHSDAPMHAGGLDVVTRVTRRSEAQLPENRLDTSEYFEQVGAPALCKCPSDPRLHTAGWPTLLLQDP